MSTPSGKPEIDDYNVDPIECDRSSTDRTGLERLSLAVITQAVEDYLREPAGMAMKDYDASYRDALEFLSSPCRLEVWCLLLGMDPEAVSDRFTALTRCPEKVKRARQIFLHGRIARRVSQVEAVLV